MRTALLASTLLLSVLRCCSAVAGGDSDSLVRVVLQTAFGEITIGLYTKEAPVVTEHFLELVRQGCMNTNHLKWDKDGVFVPGCQERQLRSNFVQRSLAADVLPLEVTSHSPKRGTLVMVPTGKERTKYESGQSSFRILLGGYSAWEGKNIFGEVLQGFSLLQHASLGPSGEKIGSSVMIVAAYILRGGADDPNDKHEACTPQNVEFYLSDKWVRSVIPLSADCIKRHQRSGLTYKANTSVLLKGLPKMGTTWTEVLTEKLVEHACKSGIYKECRFVKIGRGAVAAFASEQEGRAEVLRFSAETKHEFPAGKSCGADCWEKPSQDEIGSFYEAEVDPPRWETCVMNKKYWELHECVEDWMGPPVEEWADVWMDAAARNLTGSREIKHSAPWTWDAETDPAGLARKYILVMRDPRDSAVSLMHYNTQYDASDPSQLQRSVKEYFPHIVRWQAFWYYYQLYQVSKHWPTMLLSYRQMLENPERQYERVLDYLGLKVSVDTLDEVMAATTFSSMIRMEQDKQLPGRNHAESDRRKVRSGKAGGFMSELNGETIKFCNQVMKELLPPELLGLFGMS